MYDVIIAGAGPAGSTCARLCAKQGLSTLLLDGADFPRSKPCGGAVSTRALMMLDFPIPEKVIEKECYGVRVHCSGRSIFVRKDRRIAVLVQRDRFDSFLAEKAMEAGAGFSPGESVIDIRQTADMAEVVTAKTAYQARFLIGADGIHSRVASAVRPPFQKDETVLALISTVTDAPGTVDEQDTTIEFYFGITPLGYGWLFPRRGYCSLGIAGSAIGLPDPHRQLSDFARFCGKDVSAVRGYFIPLGGKKRAVASKRILLAGDAAGFADSLHGEGIVHAIHSGKIAARAIIDAIGNGRDPSSAASWYQHETEGRIVRELRVAHRMATLLDSYPRLFLRIFFDHPEALLRYLDIPAGRTTYRQFQRWLLSHFPCLLLPARRRVSGVPVGDRVHAHQEHS